MKNHYLPSLLGFLLFITISSLPNKVSAQDNINEIINTIFKYNPDIPCLNIPGFNKPLAFWKTHSDLSRGYLVCGTKSGCPEWVGIGTPNPITNLDLRGNQHVLGRLRIGPDNTAFGQGETVKINSKDHWTGLLIERPVGESFNVEGIKTVFHNDDKGLIAFASHNYELIPGENYQPIKVFAHGEYYANQTRDTVPVFTGKQYGVTGVKMYGNGMLHLNHVAGEGGPGDRILQVKQNSSNEPLFAVGTDKKTYVRELIVTKPSNFPDYVFQKDYPLLPLKKVKSFVDDHGHLPNVPSAKEVADRGQNLAEIQRATLEKVEELYLYIFELEQKVERLENKCKEYEAK